MFDGVGFGFVVFGKGDKGSESTGVVAKMVVDGVLTAKWWKDCKFSRNGMYSRGSRWEFCATRRATSRS